MSTFVNTWVLPGPENSGPLPGAGKSCDILWAPLGVADSPRLLHRPQMRTPPFSMGVCTCRDFTASGRWTEELRTPTGLSPRHRAGVGSGPAPPSLFPSQDAPLQRPTAQGFFRKPPGPTLAASLWRPDLPPIVLPTATLCQLPSLPCLVSV